MKLPVMWVHAALHAGRARACALVLRAITLRSVFAHLLLSCNVTTWRLRRPSAWAIGPLHSLCWSGQVIGPCLAYLVTCFPLQQDCGCSTYISLVNAALPEFKSLPRTFNLAASHNLRRRCHFAKTLQ